jgi:hypothetical protein
MVSPLFLSELAKGHLTDFFRIIYYFNHFRFGKQGGTVFILRTFPPFPTLRQRRFPYPD